VLSNGLCSLNPHVDRLAMVCVMQIDAAGNIADYQFHEAVFRSHARLTYNEVFAMLVTGDEPLRQKHALLLSHLESLYGIYKVLASARKKRGSIDFDFPETRIVFGSDRKIERIVQLVRNEAHRLIEECMLCANISAARFLMENKCAGLYRVHRGPSPEKLLDLRKFLNELALTLPGGEQPAPRDYAMLLASVAERPDLNMIQTVLLRSLSQALYSPDNEGHFSLAFEAYTHFTSPIRRYPDLLVHRAIKSILKHEFTPGKQDASWQKFGEHCSMTERRADDATREAVDWLKCEYMLDKVGEEFAGIVSSVTSFGMFVQLVDIFVEGLVHISQLPNDYWHFDPLRHEMVGERTGVRYRLGTPVMIKVARVDLDQRQMDFALPQGESDSPGFLPKKKKKHYEEPKKNPAKKRRRRKK
jgi:ribonuclease R